MTRNLPARSALALLLASGAAGAHAQEGKTGEGVARVVVFSSAHCPACRQMKATTLAALQEQHGAALEIRDLDIGEPAHYGQLLALEEALEMPQQARVIPTAILGDRVLTGSEAIAAELPRLIEEALGRGGADWPRLPKAPATPRTEGGSDQGARPVWAAYFFQTGCRECGRAEADLRWVAERHPALAVRALNIYEHTPLAHWLAERAGREGGVSAPAIFVGRDALIGAGEIDAGAIEELVSRHEAEGAPPPWEGFAEEEAEATLRGRFRAFGPAAIVVAALLDGVNPCAFATIIFLVSYLTLSGRRGGQILAVGAAFTLAVFATYLAVGLGLYRALDALGGALGVVSRWVLAGTGLLCAFLAVMSFLDWRKARRGELEDMSLNLPEALRKRINVVIRRAHRARAWIAAAFLAGVAVSLLELACTGQVYLPTLVFLANDPELRPRAMLYLVLYNVLFVLPLVVVFLLVFFGTTSQQLIALLRRRAGAVKLGMTALFTVLAAWLLATALGA